MTDQLINQITDVNCFETFRDQSERALSSTEPLNQDDLYYLYLSNSELSAWRRCRRKWWLGWHRKLRYATKNYGSNMATGNRIHRVLAAYYSPDRASDFDIFQCHKDVASEDCEALLTQREGLSSAIDGYDDSAVVSSAIGDFDKATELERIMLEGYLQWLEETGADSQYEIISCETPMISVFDSRAIHCHGDLFNLTILGIGILDARLQEIETGRRYFMDHKTVASLTDPYKTLRINTQLLHYHLLEVYSHYQSLDDSPTTVGAVYNMLKRVKRTARANPPFYDRLSIIHSTFEVSSYLTNVIGTAYDIVSAKRLLANFVSHQAAVYPSPRSECSWDCEFFSVCSLFNDGSAAEDMLGTYYVEEDPLDRYRTVPNPSTKVTDSTVED